MTGTQHLGLEINNARIERWWSLQSLAEYLEIPTDDLLAIERGELLPTETVAEELRLWLIPDHEIEQTVRNLLLET